jgi:AcrR family transcriptional regulator
MTGRAASGARRSDAARSDAARSDAARSSVARSDVARSARRRKTAAERAAEIAAAAQGIAVEQGLGAITLRAIGERLGVASSLVAHYRPSMDDLVADTFAALAGAEVDELAADLAARADDTPTARLAWLIGSLTGPDRAPLSAVWADAWSLGRRNDALAAAARAGMDAWLVVAAEIVRAGVDAGEFRVEGGGASAVAELLFALVDATAAYGLVGYRSRGERAALIRSTVAVAVGVPVDALV